MGKEHEVRNENGKLTYPKGDGEISIQIPKGEFRRYIQWEGRWRHVYVVSTHYQTIMFEPPMKMVDFKLSKNSKVVYTAERDKFYTDKPKTRKNVERIS